MDDVYDLKFDEEKIRVYFKTKGNVFFIFCRRLSLFPLTLECLSFIDRSLLGMYFLWSAICVYVSSSCLFDCMYSVMFYFV